MMISISSAWFIHKYFGVVRAKVVTNYLTVYNFNQTFVLLAHKITIIGKEMQCLNFKMQMIGLKLNKYE